MRYCVPYYKTFKYMDEVDEIIVPFVKEDINFIKSLTSKEKLINGTVIIEVQDKYDFYDNQCIGIFKALKENYPEVKFKLMFDKYADSLKSLYKGMKDHEIPFFFSTYVRDWDTLNGLISIGVSDVYVVEEMGFSLNKIGPVAHAAKVSIRVFANIAQSSWSGERSIKSFFIRPEDIAIYESVVDVIEFFGDDLTIQEVMYKVYAIDKKWFGPLKEIILGLESDVDSRSIPPAMFARYRIACEKKCAKGGRGCSICERFVDVANNFTEQGLYFKY